MLTVETIARVRREHRKGKSARSIARELRLSRVTVTKYIGSEETAPRYKRKKQSYPKLEKFKDDLIRLLEDNEREPCGDRVDFKRIFQDLVRLGYKGGYDSVRRFGKSWKHDHGSASGLSQAFVPLAFSPGEAYQFDWAEDYVVLDGVTVKVQVAHVRLCHSRMPYLRVYPCQKQEMVFDAHEHAFKFWGGSCERGIYDNMKTAVDSVFIGKERKFNRRFSQMCSHYLVEPVACTPASGWEKGQVENQVGTLRERLFKPRPQFKTMDELNVWLEEQCVAHAKSSSHPELTGRTVWDVFQDESKFLIKTPSPFDGFRDLTVPASKTCLVRFDRNRYSVNATAAGKPVQVKVYAERIEIRLDGDIVGEHRRVFGRGRTLYNPLHYIPILDRKPGALRNGAPFREWVMPEGLAGVQARLGRSNDGDRQFAGILAAILTDGEEAVEAACRQALADGPCSKDVVLNLLARQKIPLNLPPVAVPTALALTLAPTADCARFNSLLSKTVAPKTGEAFHGTP